MAYRYHPPTVDSLDIEPSSDGLAVRIGIFNTTDNGTYTSIEVMNRDLEDVIIALRAATEPVLPSATPGISFGVYASDTKAPRPTVNQERLLGSTDAAVWAEEFAKFAPDVDEGTMIGWFANTIETATQHARTHQ